MQNGEPGGSNTHRCVECGAVSPRTETNYTLISARYGWRLSRREENGRKLLEWRCPECWTKRRHKLTNE